MRADHFLLLLVMMVTILACSGTPQGYSGMALAVRALENNNNVALRREKRDRKHRGNEYDKGAGRKHNRGRGNGGDGGKPDGGGGGGGGDGNRRGGGTPNHHRKTDWRRKTTIRRRKNGNNYGAPMAKPADFDTHTDTG